jgi:hypothetical protein
VRPELLSKFMQTAVGSTGRGVSGVANKAHATRTRNVSSLLALVGTTTRLLPAPSLFRNDGFLELAGGPLLTFQTFLGVFGLWVQHVRRVRRGAGIVPGLASLGSRERSCPRRNQVHIRRLLPRSALWLVLHTGQRHLSGCHQTGR